MVSSSGLSRKKKVWIGIGVFVGLLFIAYNVVGFFVVPSIVEKQLTQISSERLGLTSRVEKISFNPYSFELSMHEFSASDETGSSILGFNQIYLNLALIDSVRSKSAILDEFNADQLHLTLEQIDSETTNISRIVDQWNQSASPVTEEEESEADSAPPAVVLKQFRLSNSSIEIIDRIPEVPLVLNVRPINLNVSNITTIPGESLTVGAAMNFSDGGQLEFSGTLSYLPELNAQLEYTLTELSMAWLQPYIAEYSSAELMDGHVSTSGVVTSTLENSLLFQGDLSLNQIDLQHESESFLAWEQLALPEIQFSMLDSELNIGAVELYQPFAKTIIFADGGTNIGQILGSESEAVEAIEESEVASEEAPEEAIEETETDEGSSIVVIVDSITISEGSAYFSDLSLPLPFATNLSRLEGSISTLATNSDAPAAIELDAQADEFGHLKTTGSINPKDPADLTELELIFSNISLPEYSPYLIKLAGQKIDSGKLDLDLIYRINQGSLEGENNIVLRDFTLGEKVESPDALNLPLGLALALLRDPDGTIDLDLPVSGNLSDPQFSYGGIIRKALVNLITGIVTSPFKLLGNLVGSDDEQLDILSFEAGNSELTPPEREKLTTLAEALIQRPSLTLELPAVFNEEADSSALKEQLFEAELETLMQSISDFSTAESLATDRRVQALEQLYEARNLTPELTEARLEFETAATETVPASFDSAAYIGKLNQQLISSQPLADDSLSSLAQARAEAAKTYLLEIQPSLASQVGVLEAPNLAELDDKQLITMEMELVVSEN